MPDKDLPADLRNASVADVWAAIEVELERLSPKLLPRLEPGCGDAEIERLQSALGLALPSDFTDSLRRHSGGRLRQDVHGTPYSEMLFSDLGLTAPRALLPLKQWLDDGYAAFPVSPHDDVIGPVRRDVYWSAGWIPFAVADEDRALFYCIDCDPGGGGTYGQIISAMTNCGDRRVEWTGMVSFLAGHVLGQLRTTAAADPDDPSSLRLDGDF